MTVDMSLPNNKTCSDCVHYDRCKWLIGILGQEKSCDWYPIKFVENTSKGKRI